MTKHGRTMSILTLGAALAGASFGSASAQTPATGGDNSGNLLNRPYLTSTGQVVPKPGALKDLPQAQPDRNAQQQDDAIMKSICSNC